MKGVASQWGALSDAEKAPYLKKAKQIRTERKEKEKEEKRR